MHEIFPFSCFACAACLGRPRIGSDQMANLHSKKFEKIRTTWAVRGTAVLSAKETRQHLMLEKIGRVAPRARWREENGATEIHHRVDCGNPTLVKGESAGSIIRPVALRYPAAVCPLPENPPPFLTGCAPPSTASLEAAQAAFGETLPNHDSFGVPSL
jgi:hypothetical protein